MKKLCFFLILISCLAFLNGKPNYVAQAASMASIQTTESTLIDNAIGIGNATLPAYQESTSPNLLLPPVVNLPTPGKTASVSGNWSDTATWGGNSVPTSADAVTINGAITVTVDQVAECASISTLNTGSIIISGTNSLAVTGLVYMARPSAASTNFTIAIGTGTATFGSLTMAATLSSNNNIITVSTGSLTINGAVTTGTTGCQLTITGEGTLNLGGTIIGTPILSFATASTVNYTSDLSQTILKSSYGNLGLSGTGSKYQTANNTTTVKGNLTNNSTLIQNAGSTSYTLLSINGNIINNGTINGTAANCRIDISGTVAQTFNNLGTVTAPLTNLSLGNINGVTLLGNGFTCARVNLFYGMMSGSSRLTIGNGGTTTGIIQIAMSTSYTKGYFDVAPNFNGGTGGIQLIYAPASTDYATAFEIPADGNIAYMGVGCTPRTLTLTNDLTIANVYTNSLVLSSGNLYIGAHTISVNGQISVAAGTLTGSTSSNLTLTGNLASAIPSVIGGLNNLVLSNPLGYTMNGSVNVYGQLTLTDGILTNGNFLTMAPGSTISRTSNGSLRSTPTFAGTINLIYSGNNAIAAGLEVPVNTTSLNNLTTNSGGMTQLQTQGGTTSNLYTQGFNAAPTDWITEIVTNPTGTAPFIGIASAAGSSYPAVTPSEGTSCIQFNSYDCESGDQIRLKMTSPIVTTGKTNIGIAFDWYMDNGYSSNNDNVTVQWSTNGTSWNSANVYFRYSATNGWVTNSLFLPAGAENQATLYLALLFTSGYGNNCHLDNLIAYDYTPGLPIPSYVTINGTLDLVGNYTIGTGNTLTINGNVINSGGSIIGNTTSNMTIGSAGTVTVPAEVNTLTIDNPGVVLLPGNVIVGTLVLSGGSLNLNGNSISFFAAPGVTFPGTGIVTGLSAAETVNPLLPAKINRQWLISGGITSPLTATFIWSASDDGDFDWTGYSPVVYQGTTKLTTLSYGLRTVTVAINTFAKDGFTVGFETAGYLPVELSSFTAIASAQLFVNLQWTTESETNNQGFNVYRSFDSNAANAVKINVGMITGTNTTSTHTYRFVDNEIEPQSVYYYWLEMVNFDGSSTFTNYVTVNTSSGTPVVPTSTVLKKAFPNPFSTSHSTTIGLDVKNGETAILTIYNVRGQIVKSFIKEAGSHSISWNGQNDNGTVCGSGIYFYNLTSESMNITKKLMIIK